MTAEEFLALPDDGVKRWLIRGQLREKKPQPGGTPMTVRDRTQCRIMAQVAACLADWLDQQPQPRGQVLFAGAPMRLRRDPDTIVGIDIAYVSAGVMARQSDDTRLVNGVPVLAVEVLAPKDTQGEINEKTDEYLSAGVALVWVINPYRRMVLIYQPEAEPAMANERQELSGEPHLPGFRVPVAQLFA